jgi:hypothetical protein
MKINRYEDIIVMIIINGRGLSKVLTPLILDKSLQLKILFALFIGYSNYYYMMVF